MATSKEYLWLDSTRYFRGFRLDVLKRRISGRWIQHQHYATTEIYVEEVQKFLEGAEEAVTQIYRERSIIYQEV